MAHTRRSPHHRTPSSSLSSSSIVRKKYLLRRAATRTSSHAPQPSSSPPAPDHRPVLVPLHPNLRRLPSRFFPYEDSDKDMVLRGSDQVIQVGAKRKRVAATNENALANGRPTRGSSRRKRLRTVSMTKRYVEYFSDDSDIEMGTASTPSSTATEAREETEEEVSGTEDEDEDEDELSTDDHLLRFATTKTLARLRKPDLVRLYGLAGLPDDAELLTKHEIIDCLIGAREDYASLPPSSPVGRGDCSSSGSLSDDGNVAGGEETDAAPMNSIYGPGTMRRRVTLHDLSKLNGRLPKSRSMSMGNLANHDAIILGHGHSKKGSIGARGGSNGSSTSKRRSSARSSPTSTAPPTSTTHSPPVTRLRTRKVSTAVKPTSATSKSGKPKGKFKQVEFKEEVDIKLQTPSKRRLRERERERETRAQLLVDESDLTDVDEVEQSIRTTQGGSSQPQLSPRRLRSKDRESDKGKGKRSDAEFAKRPEVQGRVRRSTVNSGEQKQRIAPIPKMRRKAKVPREEELEDGEALTEEEEEEEDQLQENEEGEEDEEDEKEVQEVQEDEEGQEEEEEEEEEIDGEDAQEEEEEIDELASSTSVTPPSSCIRRTPLRKRLRPRTRKGSTAPDDGDIEDEGEEDGDDIEDSEEDRDDIGDGIENEEVQESGSEMEGGDEDAERESEDEATIAVEPRKLRSGKVVGEEDVEMETAEEDIGEEDSETGEEEGEEVEANKASDIDVDAEGETDEDEVMEAEVDLTLATAKTLVRLRRDDLVRLCETRDLEPVGTKPQLAEALLQWRDRHAGDRSSPSSTGTVRPPSTSRRHKRKKATSSAMTIPVLLRPEHVHEDEPRTPVPDQEKDAEQELELDLESLGLEDREIPPEKLTKLEKIGSGGFKDVFIGKFKGRRVAISEFRGTLSAMDIKELKLLGGFDHPNIVRFLGVSIPENTKETPVMIVSELCSNGDLYDYIRNINTPFLHKVLNMMQDIARGLEYLHTRKPSIIHRDCKSSNILITARGTAKIADFGLAKVKQSTRSMVKSLVGTVNWQAPELWTAHPKYNHKVDVFSCALVFWEMLQWHLPTRKHPWEGMNEHAIYDIVGAKRQRPNTSGLRKQWCPEIVDLMERMWIHEHQDRPTMTEVVQELEDLLTRY